MCITKKKNRLKLIKFIPLSFLTMVLNLSVAYIASAKGGIEERLDILIIYSSGVPYNTISALKGKDIDAVTAPTPMHWNCKKIANELVVNLRDRKLKVKAADATEIQSIDEIMEPRIIVIGSPARFWNVSWEIKKLLDEQFGQIYMLNNKGLRGKRIAAFSMAETKGSAEHALENIKKAVKDCNGKFGPNMKILTTDSSSEIKKKIQIFTRKIFTHSKDF